MSDQSARLSLPYVMPAQAQKHVTVNEAFSRLDRLVQLVLEDPAAETPPLEPEAGQVWGLGANPVGAWAGQAGHLASWDASGWQFLLPVPGWSAVHDGRVLVWTGTAWEEPPLPDLANLPGVGINTGHDVINRLSVSAPATLLTHEGSGHQLKVNKAASGDTASLLFQTGWSGRAEMGTAGSDDFAIKVSADGTSWATGLSVAASDGRVDMANGLTLAGTLDGSAVQGTPADLTPDRVLRTGAFGLGTAITLGPGDDLDTLPAAGLYYNPTSGNTAGNNYPITSAGSLLNLRRTATNWTQRFTSYGGNSTAEGVRIFERSYGVNGWSPWVELFHQGTLLGTVSQNGGVPTGRVIERGANANGAYVRWADGTQICTVTAAAVGTETAAGAIYMHSALLVWTFPALFVAGSVVVSGDAGNAARWLGPSGASATSCSYRVYSFGSSGTLSSPSLMAVGRWF